MRTCLIVVALTVSVNNGFWLYWVLACGVESVGLAPDGVWETIVICFLSVGSFAMSLGSLGFLIDRFAPPKKSNLIRCPDCKRTLSRSAATCPHCGCPIVSIPGTAAAKSEGKDGSPFTPDSVEDAWRRVLGYSAFPFIRLLGRICGWN